MTRVCFFAILVGLLLIAGCSKDCPECEDCPEENPTDVEPPFINNIYGPGDIIIGNLADFGCDIVSDADIIQYSWDLTPFTGDSTDYYFPDDGTPQGEWTPTGERPSLISADAEDSVASYTYYNRGIFIPLLQIEDEDGYIERANTVVRVNPETPDEFDDIVQLAQGLEDTIYGNEFEVLRFGAWTTNGCLASIYTDGYNEFHDFCYIDSLSGWNERQIYSWVETGKKLQVFAGEPVPGDIVADFDIAGALHLWDYQPEDYIEITVYLSFISESGISETFYLFSETLQASDAYWLNSNHNITIPITVNEGYYEIWFGLQVEVYSQSGGAAVCLDGENGFTLLNYVFITLNK